MPAPDAGLRRHLDVTVTGILSGPGQSRCQVPVAPGDTVSAGLGPLPSADVLLQRGRRTSRPTRTTTRWTSSEVAGHDPGNGGPPSFAAVSVQGGGLVDPLPVGSLATLDLAPLTDPLGVAVTGWGAVEPIVSGQRPSLRLQTAFAGGLTVGDPHGLHALLEQPVLDPRISADGWGLRAGLERLELTIPHDVAGEVVGLLLPRDGLTLRGRLVFVADDTGLHVEGGIGLRTVWPDTVRLPGLLVRGLTTEITTGPSALTFTAAGTVTVDLGVLTATVEGLGLSITAGLRPHGDGNLGLVEPRRPPRRRRPASGSASTRRWSRAAASSGSSRPGSPVPSSSRSPWGRSRSPSARSACWRR